LEAGSGSALHSHLQLLAPAPLPSFRSKLPAPSSQNGLPIYGNASETPHPCSLTWLPCLQPFKTPHWLAIHILYPQQLDNKKKSRHHFFHRKNVIEAPPWKYLFWCIDISIKRPLGQVWLVQVLQSFWHMLKIVRRWTKYSDISFPNIVELLNISFWPKLKGIRSSTLSLCIGVIKFWENAIDGTEEILYQICV